MQWLEILHQFIVIILYTSQKFAQCVALTLQELAEDGVRVLPALESPFVEELSHQDLFRK